MPMAAYISARRAGRVLSCATEWDGFGCRSTTSSMPATRWSRSLAISAPIGRPPQNTQMAYVWRIADGRAVWFQQYADTLAVARVTGAA